MENNNLQKINKGSIEEILRESKQGMHVKDIASFLMEKHYPRDLFEESLITIEKVLKKVSGILSKEVKKSDSLFSKVRNPKTKGSIKGFYKLKTKRIESPPLPTNPIPPKDPDDPIEQKQRPINLYKGKAGEYAVMSELLFRGYNVNNMAVDEGIDVVANKNNLFYYIQVKTTELKENNKLSVSIDWKRFSDYFGNQMRYFIVVRCSILKREANVFFQFTNSEINRLIFEKQVKKSNNHIHIKIEIDQNTGDAYIYDDKRGDANYFKNRFELML